MNSKNSIYDMSKKIEEEEQFRKQARIIANAYRKVEQLKVVETVPKEQKKPKNQSAYAMKIKQTLKQINANKAKQMESIAKYVNERPPIVPSNFFSKLQKAAVTKILNTLEAFDERILKESYRHLITYFHQQYQKEHKFIEKFKLFKYFRAWRSQIKQQKAQRLKKQQQQTSIDVKSMELAKQFRTFCLLKKSFKNWHLQTKKQIRRKQYERQLIREQIKAQEVQPKVSKNKVIEQNSQLQSKVKGFLDGLKQKIVQNDRLKTIKEKTEQSKANQQNRQSINELSSEVNQQQQEQNHPQEVSEAELVIQPPIAQQQKKQMTNDDLEKKRKQLEAKHKNRKQALQKLRKQKQLKRIQQQRLRIQMQKQIQIEQKRMKQEKYRQYLKNKQEEAQWEKRQKELTALADEYNIIRLKKFYGLNPWKSIKTRINQNIALLHQALVLIIYRIKGNIFVQNMIQVGQQRLNEKLKKMNLRYRLSLLRKGFLVMKSNRVAELQQKQVYDIMHNVNTLKIAFNAWKRIRNLIAGQNYDWQKPRIKRAEEFYVLQLKHKTIKALEQHKEISKKEKCIEQQKNKIKNKIKNMLEENIKFDYQQYL